MEKLIVLGTGNAMVTKCYNTCFALYDDNEYFLVDAGGGNGILQRFEEAQIDYTKLHHIFITHEHTDHLLGVIWLIRKIGTLMLNKKYEGPLHIYCHEALIHTIQTISELTLQKKLVNLLHTSILLIPVADGETKNILDHWVTFFDIHSTKAKQFGFTMKSNQGSKLTCIGDEPYHPLCKEYVADSNWLLSEAFCLYSEREKFKPYEKHHSTVKEACELGQQLNIKNLVLWHTEDQNIENRKALYIAEGRYYYTGNLFVPDDLDIIDISLHPQNKN